MLHKNILPEDMHGLAAWKPADSTAMAALVLAPEDEGKVAWRQDNDSFYLLINSTGPVWKQLIFADAVAADAENISIEDTGAYFTGTNVEDALQEIGLALEEAGTGSGSGLAGVLTLTSDTTMVLEDANKLLYMPSSASAGVELTIPANGDVAIPVPSLFPVVNDSSYDLSVLFGDESCTVMGAGLFPAVKVESGTTADLFKIGTTDWLCTNGVGFDPSEIGYITDGLISYLDAGNATSYGGSGQTWANLEAAPADGSAQSDYSWYRGSGSSSDGQDPAFTGTPGTDVCYFTLGGSYVFTLAAGTVPDFMKKLHQSGKKFSFEVWFQYKGDGDQSRLIDTGTADYGGSYTSRGLWIGEFNANHLVCRVMRDNSGARSLDLASDDTFTADGIYMVGWSQDSTGAENSFLYRNGSYLPVGSNNTWDGTLSSPGSLDSSQTPRIGRRGSNDYGGPATGTKIYLVRIYNRNLSKAEFDTNWENDRARFGL